jgi:hypothetical protein
MMKNNLWRVLSLTLALGLLAALMPQVAQADPPVVKTVPWVATNPLIAHDTYNGKTVTLKGTCDSEGANFQYSWDFGDGSPPATGIVSNKYVIEATHAYIGIPGQIFTARLTVTNTSTGEQGNQVYYVGMQDKNLDVEANIAIDEGLWYLHKTQTRTNMGGFDIGYWDTGFAGSAAYQAISAANVNAFEVNGYLENGPASNPYTETVARGMRYLFTTLVTVSVPQQTNPLGTFNPDSNGNGIGIVNEEGRYDYYTTGMFIDAIVASGTPDAVTPTGAVNIVGRKYREIIQDMVDAYAWAQWDSNPQGGGWRYNPNQAPDNSSCQWAAIGLIPAERVWGCIVPPIVKEWNKEWLWFSQAANGSFGYTNKTPIWGPYATTPSGMVQMAMDGIGRGTTDPDLGMKPDYPSWDKAETFIRDNFCNTGGPTVAIKDYYYGLFSFVKAMLLHDSNGDGIPEPIKFLQSSTPGVVPIDWYTAEASKGDSCDGVARTLINDQNPAGYWSGHNYNTNQYYFETAWAIIMLNRTIFEAGAPVAVAKAIPNPGVVGQIITLDGSDSFHQDPAKSIVLWEWDLNNDAIFDVSGVTATTSFPDLGNYPVTLRVTDNASPPKTTETIVTVLITTPPVAPTADAGGPYVFCPQSKPWFLDATKSINPDEGASLPGAPGDTIYGNVAQFAWDLDGDNSFDDAYGQQPDVTAFFESMGPGAYLVQLRVTDTSATSFPGVGPDLFSISSGQVIVRAANDPACSCIRDLAARAKLNKVQLTWSYAGVAASYNVYRSTISGGPYVKIANTTSSYCTYLDTGPLATGTTYYYVVRPALLNEDELCQSNQASARPVAR